MTTPAPSPRNNFLKVLIPIVVIIAIVAGGLYLVKTQLTPKSSSPQAEGAPPGGAHIGTVLPDFTLTGIQGGSSKFSDYKDKVILVNFWATWCEACMEEMPTLVKLRNAYRDKGFEVLGINLDENGETVVPKTMKQLGISFPVFTDADGKITDYFDVHAIPLTVIVGADRKILYIENGERDWNDQDIHHQLDQWLSQEKS